MISFRSIASLIRTLLGRPRFEDEMAEELRFHIEERAEHLVREGAERKEALRQARLEFGGTLIA